MENQVTINPVILKPFETNVSMATPRGITLAMPSDDDLQPIIY